MKHINKFAILLCAVLVQTFVLTSCKKGNSAADARMNASITARLGDIMKDDYHNALAHISSKGVFVKTDVFGNDHVFKENERALNYIASINQATFEVMDSLSLSVEAAALSNADDANLKKLNTLVRKYVTLCKNPVSAGKELMEMCNSLSQAIDKTVTEGGEPDKDKLQMQLGLAGNAIMQKEMKAAQLAGERNKEAAQIYSKEGEDFLAENAKKEGVVTLPSGLQYRVIRNVAGAHPTDNSQVLVSYEGRFTDGKVFDGTDKNNGGKPVWLGMGSVVRGWNEALKLMGKGSEWEIFLPYELGYGEEGMDEVPPCSALIFKIKLVDIK